MYYLQLISLKDCPYSEAANSLVTNNKINSKITIVNRNEKDKFKTKEIDTFPQVYLKKEDSNGSILLGGYTELKSYYDLVQSGKNNNDALANIKNSIKTNQNMSDKSILRLIQLLI